MSQEKVDARKEYKKNRKEILAREKRFSALRRLAACLLILVMIGGVGWSIYKKVKPEPAYDITAFYNLIETDDYGILSPTIEKD